MTRAEKKAATRKKLSAIAHEAFRHQGYEEVTFRSLANIAGVSTGAFLYHWKSKAELFSDVMGRPAPDLAAFLAQVAVTCAGYPGAVGELAMEAEQLRKTLIGQHG